MREESQTLPPPSLLCTRTMSGEHDGDIVDDLLVNNGRLHYSYISLAFGTLAKTLTSAGQSPCIGVVLPNLRADLGLTLTRITMLYMFATTCSALLLPFCGRLIQKTPIRHSVTIISIALAVACFFFSTVRSEPALFVALFCLRFFGQGNLFNVSIVFINNWWVELKGTAMGIAGACVSALMLGGMPVIMMRLVDRGGWRGCYKTLALVELIGAFIAACVWREGPEKYGALPDGKYGGNSSMKRKDSNLNTKAADADLKQPSLLSPTFLTFVLSDLLAALTGTAFYFLLQQIFVDAALPDSFLSFVYPTMALVGIVGRIVSGRLIDKLNHQTVFLWAMLLSALSLFMIPSINVATLFICAPAMGFSMSSASNIRGTVHAHYYGRSNLGKLQSVASSATVLGSALGPFPFGLCRDHTGSFDLAFYASGVASLLAAFAIFKFGANPNEEKIGDGPAYEMVKAEVDEDEEEEDSNNDEP